MRSIRQIAFAVCGILGLAGHSAFAQQAPATHAPEIHAAMNSADELFSDLKFLCELVGPQGVRGWKPLEQFLEMTFDGTDKSKPDIVDVLLNPNGSQVRAHFPLKDPPGKPLGQKFLANLRGIGIDSRKLVMGFYQLGGGVQPMKGAAFNGFLRVLNAPISYASLAEDRALLPANLADPRVGPVVAALLARNYDLGLLLKNGKVDDAAIKARRADFQKVRENLMAGLKQQPGATAEGFAVEKAVLDHNLSELERFAAESAELALGWTTDALKKEARLDLELTAIPMSDLDVSAKLLGNAPGMFSGVPRSETAILSGRIHFPLDQLRQSNLVGAMPLFRAATDARINASTGRTPEQKSAYKAAAKLWYDMIEAGANAGVLDGLIEVSQAQGEKANLLFAIKAPDSNAVKGILELIPQINPEYKVQFDVEKIGDTSIHTIQTPEKDDEFEMIFGKEAAVYVATGPQAWWVAIGTKSLDQLKKAIGEAGQPNAAMTNNFLTLFYRVGPWIEFLDTRRARLDAQPTEKKLTEAEIKSHKDRATHRKLALEAFKEGKDSVETKLEANNGRVTGSTRFDEGLLKFIGSEIAKFSNETLK